MHHDTHFLVHAIRQGARGLGRTWPNPSVGCVLVKNNQIIAAAYTAETGRPHAETIALASAGMAARGATAYVSLEPCAHHGKTPPCAQALIEAGVARVVIAAMDPDPRVNGKGAAMLEAAGIAVEKTLLPAAAASHRGFFSRIEKNRPYVMMKLASSTDGYMSDASGKSQWITGPAARAHGHGLRNTVDAVLTGIGTALADDPMLNVRLPGIVHDRLVRIIADRKLRLGLESQLVSTAEMQATWIVTSTDAIEQRASHATELRERGVNIIALEDTQLAPTTMLSALASAGITRLLVEAGPTISTAFIAANCVDTLYWYRAPILLGAAGNSAIHALDSNLNTAPRHTVRASFPIGGDRCDILEF